MLGRIWGRYRAKIRKSVTKCMKKVGLVSKIVDKLNENLLNVSLFVLIVLPNGKKVGFGITAQAFWTNNL